MRWIFIFLFFIGCSKEFVYLDTNVSSVKKVNKVIGVSDINLPLYMRDLELMKNENNILTSTSIYLSRDLKNLIISYLSYELNDPYVFSYPFSFDKKPDVLVKINIDDFFIKDRNIFLKARVFINKNFLIISLKEKCNKNYECVSKILKKFTLKIAKEIK